MCPLSSATVSACFFLSFLLAFNEYPRTYYLSGSDTLLSEFLNGKLSSGAEESIYAAVGGIILVTAIVTVGYVTSRRFLSGRARRKDLREFESTRHTRTRPVQYRTTSDQVILSFSNRIRFLSLAS